MIAGMRKAKYLYLGLALACFAGIVCIFIVDGYLGVYDILYIKHQEYELTIEFDSQRYHEIDGVYQGPQLVLGEPVSFRYRIDNRMFSPQDAQLIVSVWKGDSKLTTLLDKHVRIDSFSHAEVSWSLSYEELTDIDLTKEEYTNYTLKISFADKERRIIFGYRGKDLAPPLPVQSN